MAESRLSSSTATKAVSGREPAREPSLDGLRGIAVLLVYLYHYGGGLHNEHIGGRVFGYLTQAGWTGVVLLFALSGFLITGGLLAPQKTPHWLRNFYVRRALRILPLYYFSLGLAFVCSLATSVRYDEMKPLVVYAAFLQNVPRFVSLANMAPPPLPLYHFWTLAVEEQFYLLWPALLLILIKRRAGLPACLLLFALSAAFRVVLWGAHTSEAARVAFAGSLPVHAGALALGAALAFAANTSRWASFVRFAPWLFASAIVGYLLIGLCTGSLDLNPSLQFTLGLVAVGLAGAALVLLALRRGLTQRVLSIPPLRWLGRISYGVYVFHILLEPIFNAIGTHVAHLEYGPKYQAVRFVVALPLSIAAAAVSFVLLESPFLDLKCRFPLHSSVPLQAEDALTPSNTH